MGEQADGGGMGEELARCGSSAVEVRLKKKLTCEPHTSVREGREVTGGILDHTKIHRSASGSKNIKYV